jgi:hypothetical protein
MRITIDNLIVSVRKLIDEVAHDAVEDFSTDLNAEIEQSVIMAAQKLKRDLGRQFLIPVDYEATLVYQDGDGSGTATLPDDFGTVVEFQLKGWKQPVTDLIEPNSTEAKQQMHPWTKGSPSKPVAMVTLKDGANVLKYWSAPKKNGTYSHELDHFHYLPVIDESTDVLHIADEVYDLLLYQSASLLMLSKGETAIAEQLASMGTLQPLSAAAATTE